MTNLSTTSFCKSIFLLVFLFTSHFISAKNLDLDRATIAACDYADTCEESADNILYTLTQENCSSPIEYITIPACLDNASPGESTNCMGDAGPTVWFQINIDEQDAARLITHVNAPGFEAVWSVYKGSSCNDLMPIGEEDIIDGVLLEYECSNSDNNPDNIFQTYINKDGIFYGDIYWVAVTALGEISDPNFDFSYNSVLECLACNGENSTDCNNGNFTASVMQDGEWLEVEDDYQFCQDQEVQVCVSFEYNTTGAGNDWFHGFVPIFGPGWDVSDSDFDQLIIGPGLEFFSSQGMCPPMINGYDIPNVCTYMEDGVLKLCNSACNVDCPCAGGIQDGDPLPSGFWYNTNGGTATCGELGCSPASFFGWPGGTAVFVDFCLDLRTKSFDTAEEYNEKSSLKFEIQTFSDAISGCWSDDQPCIVDPSYRGPAWEINCNLLPNVIGENQEICSDQTLEILLQTEDGSITQIQVDVLDNPNVTGENSFTFEGGSGFINDMLVNLSDDVQTVIYNAYAVDPMTEMPGLPNEIVVVVYPVMNVIIDPVEICEGECVSISPNVAGGTGGPYVYSWSTGDLGMSIDPCPLVTTTYLVTISDSLGCLGLGETTIVVHELDSDYCMDPCQNQNNDYQIVGTAYSDVNENGLFDDGDVRLNNVLVTNNANNFTVFTNSLGQYVMPVEAGVNNLTASNSIGSWEASSIDINDIQVVDPCMSGIDFAFVPAMSLPDAQITVTNSITRCDFETKFYITVENKDHESFSGDVTFTFDEEATFFASDIPGYQVNGNTVNFETGDVLPFMQNEYVITLKMPSGSSVLPLLDFDFQLEQDGANLDSYTYSDQLRCSYDPNDKRTNPDREGDENLTLLEENLDYTIRFQNNGNDTAFHVRIVDELDVNLNPRSIRFNASSHPFYACIMDNQLIVDFNDINLVDSTTNYAGSQGFISFSIDTDTDLTEGTIIYNTADIIFDTNEAIVTNTSINTIVYDFCTDPITELSSQICEGDNYLGYNETGVYQDTIVMADGCDSILIIDLTVFADIYLDEEVVTICEDDDYEGLNVTGIYNIEMADPQTGCPIIRTINLTVLPLTDEACLTATNSISKYNIQIFPNPTGSVLNVESDYLITAISLYSTTGMLLYQSKRSDYRNAQVDLTFQSSGLYLLHIETEAGRLIEKVVRR